MITQVHINKEVFFKRLEIQFNNHNPPTTLSAPTPTPLTISLLKDKTAEIWTEISRCRLSFFRGKSEEVTAANLQWTETKTEVLRWCLLLRKTFSYQHGVAPKIFKSSPKNNQSERYGRQIKRFLDEVHVPKIWGEHDESAVVYLLHFILWIVNRNCRSDQVNHQITLTNWSDA